MLTYGNAKINQYRAKINLKILTLKQNQKYYLSSSKYTVITNDNMKCVHCGEENNNEAQFCKSCGLKPAQQVSAFPKNQAPQKSFFSSLGGTILGILVLVIIYVVINGVMWLGQEAYHHEDNAQLEQMETKINKLDSQISSFESRMKLSGTTEAEYANYQKMVDDFNKTSEEYNALAQKSGTRWYLIPIPGGHTKSTNH